MCHNSSWLIKCSVALAFYSCLCLAPPIAHCKYNVSFAQLDSCESYSIRDAGYAYRDFFMVHSLDNNKAKAGERLHLKFYVLTTMDAHILLSVTNHVRPNDRVYEIVIGAGGNTFSAIRTAMGVRRVSTNQDRNLLSLYEPTPIEIVQTQNAELFVYIPGFKKEPLLQFIDASALTINYISFSSFGTNTARWFYDCGFDGFDKEISADVKAPTVEQKLLAQINLQAENASLPSNLSSLPFHFQARSLAYEMTNSLLRTRMHFMMHWQDDRLRWNPADYGYLESFEHRDLQVWTPHMRVLNGALDSMDEVLRSYELRVFSNGNVTLYVNNLQLTSWCVDSARNWPKERVTCDIELGLIGQKGDNQVNLALIYDQKHSPVAPNEHVNTPSGWTFLDISVVQVGNDSVNRYTQKSMLQTMAGDVAIEFTIQRNSSFYMTVFYVPLIACQIFLILSFVLRSSRRSALILLALLITAWGMMYLTRHASPHYVPPIMSAYKVVMITTSYCYILHICLLWLELFPPRAKAPDCLAAVINCNILRCILGLRLADANDFCDIQEKPWPHLAKILNNLSSVVVIVIFAVVNITSGL
ncbi:neuronal acetylcholine receptor subunit alpha-3 [Drosophila serrata]|uniref:neuronal acetylcholine receptor subunit alpha-3 n=1 Tax=Drosophila serrata TaxID=7274 RepID=UPI000A1D0FE5|nr:neuronal acetylcholine receptor subunit alpha-3 [Drosophila serrata]